MAGTDARRPLRGADAVGGRQNSPVFSFEEGGRAMGSTVRHRGTLLVAVVSLVVGVVLGALVFPPAVVQAQNPARLQGLWATEAVGSTGVVIVGPQGKVYYVGLKKKDRDVDLEAVYFTNLRDIERRNKPVIEE
jgi:hypothetical protein